jgi:hypothetical protein
MFSYSLFNVGKTIAIGKITRLIERGEEEVQEGVANLHLATA